MRASTEELNRKYLYGTSVFLDQDVDVGLVEDLAKAFPLKRWLTGCRSAILVGSSVNQLGNRSDGDWIITASSAQRTEWDIC